jgi:multicomponent Na+:H+ antiporter subunit E
MTPLNSAAPRPRKATSFVIRALVFFLLWCAMMGVTPLDAVVGALTAAVAAWISLHLLPVGMLPIRPIPLLLLIPHFLWQSVVAGVDVARRAFDPRLPVRPGFIRYASRLAPGARRNAFTSYTSLLPGTVPCGDEEGEIVFHCLDVRQPVAEQLAEEERRLTQVLGLPAKEDPRA